MKVKDIINRAKTLFHDPKYVRAEREQYLEYLDDAITSLILLRPDAHVVSEYMPLVAGSKQALPAQAYHLVDIFAQEDGTPILQVERENLDYYSNWRAPVSNFTGVQEYAYDLREPRMFWVYPSIPADSNVSVEVAYTSACDKYADFLTSGTHTFTEVMDMDIPIPDIYKGPLVYYMLYLLFSLNSSSTRDMQNSQYFYNLCMTELKSQFNSTEFAAPKYAETQDGVPTNANTAQPSNASVV